MQALISAVVLLAGLGVAGVPQLSHAADQPIDGVKLVLRRSPSSEKLVFLSKDSSFLFPTSGGADDPTTAGALVEMVSQTEGLVTLAVPGGSEWTAKPSGYVFSNPSAPAGSTTIRVVKMKQGVRLKVVGRSAGFGLAGPQGQVAIRVTTGSLRNCALFDAATIRDDEADKFIAKGAVASSLADCSDAAIGIPTTTTTSSTTTTTAPPICGDNQVNQPSEMCDGGLNPGVCFDAWSVGVDVTCRAPGTLGECTCCGGASCVPDVGIYCCDDDDVCITPGGPAGPVGFCYSPTCDDPGETCASPQICVGGILCCSPLGEVCAVPIWSFFTPCCGGICGDSDGVVVRCCLDTGASCSASTDCCSGSCNGGTSTCDP